MTGAPLPPFSSIPPGGMMRAVVTCLLTIGVLPKYPTIPRDWEQEGLSCEAFDNTRDMDMVIDETPIQEELQNPTTEYSLAPIIAPVVTRKRKKRPFFNTPRVETAPAYGATRRNAPLPPSVIPSSRIRTSKQKDQSTPDPIFPAQATTSSADTILSQREHRGPYPTMV